jgi:hypothetical protein
MGAAMHPNLRGEATVEGPQMLLSGGGPRSDGYALERGVGAYAYGVPDYVTGSDSTRPPPELAEAAPAAGETETVVFTADDAPSPVHVIHAWRDEPREAPVYPSTEGGVAYADNLPPPPPPPAD